MSPCWLILLITLIAMFLTIDADSQENTKSYLVYVRSPPIRDAPKSMLHMRILQQALGSDGTANALVHSYKRSIKGFVAALKKEDVQKVCCQFSEFLAMEGVIAIFPNEKKHLHATRSWDFIGFPEKVERSSTESDIIIGVIDSGIWPDYPSFNDSGFGPPPPKWKGSCYNITCNNKITGAKYFRSDKKFGKNDIMSPIDSRGHGTHTASTAAGGAVSSASFYGLGLGTAREGVPSARIAVYKVCRSDGCRDADILAAFDEAIADGVDIISASLGSTLAHHYFNDVVAIGAFHAMKHGILTSASAGNGGPKLTTMRNVAPWSLCVAATTIDREFLTKIKFGDDIVLEGNSLNTFDLNNIQYAVVYRGHVPNTLEGYNSSISRLCLRDSMDQNLVKGKIVVCDASIVNLVNGDILRLKLQQHNCSHVEEQPFQQYLAPFVASFSSRGSNLITLDILKPDIAAPGSDILAAWSPNSPPSAVKGDKRQLEYFFDPGTSMACPHVTALAANIKSFHPSWSPAAIKSAIMTTATPLKSLKNDAEFAYGSGHINLTKALNPGLVYDANETDYINFLCGQGYNDSLLQVVTGESNNCFGVTHGSVWDLNYPSFAVSTTSPEFDTRLFKRTVTNVGSPTSTYEATLTAPEGIDIQVNPPRLSFTSSGQKLSFTVSVSGFVTSIASASLVWDDGTYQVRSPIAVFLYNIDDN
ncbi:cucumisin-like [Neltuma alba]|uniref:cucumisin-like n=1 Tax=Neltuma alba TaxID=207710 RepID=UPI0010A42F32|nr:cucumisin-like [Prosopis alba]